MDHGSFCSMHAIWMLSRCVQHEQAFPSAWVTGNALWIIEKLVDLVVTVGCKQSCRLGHSVYRSMHRLKLKHYHLLFYSVVACSFCFISGALGVLSCRVRMQYLFSVSVSLYITMPHLTSLLTPILALLFLWQAPTLRGLELFLERAVQDRWLTCMAPLARILAWAIT